MMFALNRRKLLKLIDQPRVLQAIVAAEQKTSSEIRVSISTYFWGNVERVAQRAMVRMGMTATRERNAVLLFFVPSRRKVAVIGDQGIHQKVSPEFWHQIVNLIVQHFRSSDYTDGLVHAIEVLGAELALHFPRQTDDQNELPNAIDFNRE